MGSNPNEFQEFGLSPLNAVRSLELVAKQRFTRLNHTIHMDNLCNAYSYSKAIWKRVKREMAMASVMTEEEVGRVHGSSGAVDFGRVEFLEIINVEKPRIIYRSHNKHFFFLAGLAVRTSECTDSDFESDHVLLPWLSESAN